jgi:hypothetical protein
MAELLGIIFSAIITLLFIYFLVTVIRKVEEA